MTPTRNEFIKQAIIDQLTWDSSVNSNNVRVNVQNGKVELSGNVENMAARMAAERNAQEVQGVIAVDNRLEIKFPPGSKLPTDIELKDKVETLLSWNSNLNADHIEITCDNRVITLSGKVDTYLDKQYAAELVTTVKGVFDVINELKVVPALAQKDEHIKEELTSAYKRTYLIDEDKILVEVNKGNVQLSGKVPNFLVKVQARNMAMQTSGVKEVQDDLTLA